MAYTDYITKKNAYRAWNLLVAAVVTADLLQNPEASLAEYSTDIAIHLWEALAPDTLDECSLIVNLARMTQAGRGFWTGESSIPSAANALDVYNHVLNTSHRLGNLATRASHLFFSAPPVSERPSQTSLLQEEIKATALKQ